jgi:EmrB/QacA subfamily drug resistance transporter
MHGDAQRSSPEITLAALSVAAGAYAIQQTLVLPALPVLQRELHTTPTWATWILTGFLLSSCVLTPLLGKLGDQHGKQRLLVISLLIFLAGTIGAALAPSIGVLIACRAIQGTGGAIFPLSFAIIRDEFPAERVGVAIGLISALLGVGGGLAIVTSGVIVENIGWRWLFWIGAIPIAVAAAVVWRRVPESPVRTPSRVDVPGAFLLSVTLASLLVGLSEGRTWGWTSAAVLGLFALTLVAAAAFIAVERRQASPLVDLRVFAHRPVLFTNAASLIAGFAMFLTFALVPAFMEAPRGLPPELAHIVHYGFGASATRAGVYMLPGSLVMLVAGPLGGIIGTRFGARFALAGGLAAVSAGSLGLALLHDGPFAVVVDLILLSFGVGLAFAAMPKLITDAVDRTETGVATGLNTVMRSVGGVIGGQIGAVLVTSETLRGTPVPAVDGYVLAFATSAVAGVAGIFLALAVHPRRAARVLEPEVAS